MNDRLLTGSLGRLILTPILVFNQVLKKQTGVKAPGEGLVIGGVPLIIT